MYSMKRTMTPVPRKCSTRSGTVWSLTPRWMTTVLIFSGVSPALMRLLDALQHALAVAAPAAHGDEHRVIE
jgi:hypothetical protein